MLWCHWETESPRKHARDMPDKLRDPTDLKWRPLPGHFIADLVLRYLTRERLDDRFPTLSAWASSGFVEPMDARFESSLEACRHARFGRTADALLHAAMANRLAPWAVPRIRAAAQVMQGEEFMRLVDALSAASRASALRSTGRASTGV